METSIEKLLKVDEHKNKFHPLAIKHYQEFLDDILKDVPLDSITENDIKESLSTSEFSIYESSIKNLREWLGKYLLTNNESAPNYYAGMSFFWGTYSFKNLLLKVYRQKILQQKLGEAKANAKSRAYQDSRRRHREWEAAKAEHGQWLNRVNESLATIETKLNKNTEPKFQKQAWLKSYHPEVWVKQLSSPTEDWFTAKTSKLVAAYKLILDEALRDLVSVEFCYWGYHIPAVQYEAVSPPLVSGKGHSFKAKPRIPCLKWRLATHIISIIEFWQEEGNIADTRYGYDFQVQSSFDVLGTAYSGPELWQYHDAFVTPLSLLAMLAWGGEMPGVETVKIDKPWTTYRVEGFADEIGLHENFIRFIQDMTKKTSLDEALLKRQMCDEQTALMVKEKLEKLKEPKVPEAVSKMASGLKSKTGDDYTDVVYNLTHQMGYKDAEAKVAAKFACEKIPNGTVLEKIKMALQFFEQ